MCCGWVGLTSVLAGPILTPRGTVSTISHQLMALHFRALESVMTGGVEGLYLEWLIVDGQSCAALRPSQQPKNRPWGYQTLYLWPLSQTAIVL